MNPVVRWWRRRRRSGWNEQRDRPNGLPRKWCPLCHAHGAALRLVRGHWACAWCGHTWRAADFERLEAVFPPGELAHALSYALSDITPGRFAELLYQRTQQALDAGELVICKWCMDLTSPGACETCGRRST